MVKNSLIPAGYQGNACADRFVAAASPAKQSATDLEPKRLGLLHELFPGAALFGALLNPKLPEAAQQALDLAEAARTVGRSVVLLNASTDAELDAAFATLARQRVVAMLVAGDPF